MLGAFVLFTSLSIWAQKQTLQGAPVSELMILMITYDELLNILVTLFKK